MEVKVEVLVKLKCNICKGYLSVGPVLLLENGESVCGRCSVPDEQPTIRMLPYEHLAEDMLFPCQYQMRGCTEKRSFATLKVHEANCKLKPYSCPLLAGNCGWNGSKDQLLQHCRDTHADQVLENPTKFHYDITGTTVRDFLMAAFNMLFLIHTKVCLQTEKIYHCVRLLADSSHTKDYDFTLDISNETNNVSKKGRVAAQDCQNQVEHDSLAVSINSLIGILGGYKGITFKLTINSLIQESCSQSKDESTVQSSSSREPESEPGMLFYHTINATLSSLGGLKFVQPKISSSSKPKTASRSQPKIASVFEPTRSNRIERMNCEDCNKNITYKLAYYMRENEWLCSNSVDNTVTCDFKNQGCRFKDSANNAEIHSEFYCNFRVECSICGSIFLGSLETHYLVAHCDITYPAGIGWAEKISRNTWKDLIINSNFGRLHCGHRLYYSQFKFDVRSPIRDGNLHFYTCELELRNPSNGRTNTITMPYNEEYDWRVKIDEKDFMQYVYNGIFEIKLTITKTK